MHSLPDRAGQLLPELLDPSAPSTSPHNYRAVNDAIDMNNNDLVLLIRSCLQNEQVLSKGRKKQLIARGHAAALLDDAERIIQESVASLPPQNP